MINRKILMPVRTVAEWGGVHEWTVDAAIALQAAGHEVTFVGSGEVFKKRATETGADFIDVDWSNWHPTAESIPADAGFDLIFAHGPHARAFSLKANEHLQIDLYVMIHGAYHDYMYTWADKVTGFLAASPSLVHFTQRFGRVEPWKVACVPNAVGDSVFDLPLRSLNQKLENGVGHIVTAARLAKDKLSQVDAVEEALRAARRARPEVHWKIDVYGDGPLRDFYERRYRITTEREGNSSFELHGWVDPGEIPVIMNEAVIGVSAGMAGVRTVAAGALCIGVGARNNVGVQIGKNLKAGIWSNFGDHGIMRFSPTPISKDLDVLLRPGSYEEALEVSRTVLKRTNIQSVVDQQMLASLQC